MTNYNRASSDHWMLANNPIEFERQRLALLERAFDPRTIQWLDRVPFDSRWICLEIGAGGGSITCAIAERVPDGSVLAVDLNTDQFLCRSVLDSPTPVRLERRDLRSDPDFGERRFDFVHCRAVLAYIGNRVDILRNAVRALRSGGWMLIEEPVFTPLLADDEDREIAQQVGEGLVATLKQAGSDPTFGIRVPTLLKEFGAEIVASEGFFSMGDAQSPATEFRRATHAAVRRMQRAQGIEVPPSVDSYIEILRQSDRHRAGFAGVSTLARAA
jgi:SAM-dependent methyltransferase